MTFTDHPTKAPLTPSQRPENERHILSLVRQAGAMSKADIARATGLSAQSATNIVNRLEDEGLLRAGESVRGRVGQPSKPYAIDPEGALTIGVKIGRQSVEIATMGFDYRIIEHRRTRYDYPIYDTVRTQILDTTRDLINGLGPDRAARVLGIGLSLPDALSSWESTIGAPEGSMAPWDVSDLRAEIEATFGMPVSQMNDASAACLAALKLGQTTDAQSFMYVYVGTFAGGGLAIDGRVFEGRTGNAAAIGSMPMQVVRTGGGQQLIDAASLHHLEDMAEAAGLDPQVFYADPPLSDAAKHVLDDWIAEAAPALAFTFVAGQAILDLGTMVLDTSLSDALRARLVEATRAACPRYDTRGLRPFRIIAGDLGVTARSLGSALLPFQAVTEFDLM